MTKHTLDLTNLTPGEHQLELPDDFAAGDSLSFLLPHNAQMLSSPFASGPNAKITVIGEGLSFSMRREGV